MTTHQILPGGRTACCDRTEDRLPGGDMLTTDAGAVTCRDRHLRALHLEQEPTCLDGSGSAPGLRVQEYPYSEGVGMDTQSGLSTDTQGDLSTDTQGEK